MPQGTAGKGAFGYTINLVLVASLAGLAFTAIQGFIANLTAISTGIAVLDLVISGAIALLVTVVLIFGYVEKVAPGVKKYLNF